LYRDLIQKMSEREDTYGVRYAEDCIKEPLVAEPRNGAVERFRLGRGNYGSSAPDFTGPFKAALDDAFRQAETALRLLPNEEKEHRTVPKLKPFAAGWRSKF
jgi:hypothetical protein